jgi:bifunctional non-homologous end joining protein LigD
MLVETPAQSTTLYYRQGSSDKVYQASIEPAGDLFRVNFAYGRRGATMNTGTKTNCPVSYEEAKQIYEKLLREKKAKGYTEGTDGMPYQHSDKAGRVTGILPQLLNPVDEQEVERLLHDPCWCFQPKYDGRRLLLRKAGREVTGINRKGLAVGLPECLVLAALLHDSDFIMDGEAIGLVYRAFDLLELNGENCRPLPLRTRMNKLIHEIWSNAHPYILPAQTAWITAEKQMLLQSLRQEKKEGVVMKDIYAGYTPGRPNSGGGALKHKFYATLSAKVVGINQKRSVEIGLLDEDGWTYAGNVTVPPSHNLPKPGDVIELRYLHAFPESGVLYQPLFLGVRSDIDSSECQVSQLKYKPLESEEEP